MKRVKLKTMVFLYMLQKITGVWNIQIKINRISPFPLSVQIWLGVRCRKHHCFLVNIFTILWILVLKFFFSYRAEFILKSMCCVPALCQTLCRVPWGLQLGMSQRATFENCTTQSWVHIRLIWSQLSQEKKHPGSLSNFQSSTPGIRTGRPIPWL